MTKETSRGQILGWFLSNARTITAMQRNNLLCASSDFNQVNPKRIVDFSVVHILQFVVQTKNALQFVVQIKVGKRISANVYL